MNEPEKRFKVHSISREKAGSCGFNGNGLWVVGSTYYKGHRSQIDTFRTLIMKSPSVGIIHSRIAAALASQEITAITNLANALDDFNKGE